MKKRILAILVSAAVAMSLAGCSDSENEKSTPNNTNSSSVAGNSNSGGNGGSENPGNTENSGGADGSTSNAEESKPSEPEKYPEATNVLYLQGEKLDFPETPATDFDYVIEKDQVYITEYFGKNPDVHIPETIEGKKVASLSDNDHGTIKRLIVPDNVALRAVENLESVTFLGAVSLPSQLFNCSKLTNVYFDGDLPNATQLSRLGSPWLNSIGTHEGLCVLKDTLVCGVRCSGDVVVPEGVTKIMDYAFNADAGNRKSGSIFFGTGMYEKAKLSSVTLPDGLKEIGAYAFCDTGLTSVNIPDSVTSIGESAFEKTKLETVKIPDSVSQIGSGAFYETPYLNNLPATDGMRIDGAWLLNGGGAFGHVVVPDGVKHIANNAFANVSMQSLTLPNGLVSIGDSAFSGATFKDITLPDSITDIGILAFEKSSLFSLDKYKDSKVVIFGQVAVIANYDGNYNSKNYIVPDGVKKFSFIKNYGINIGGRNVTITLPDSVDTYVTNIQYYCDTVIYKGNTYNISRNTSLDWVAERDAFKAAVEGN